MSIDTKNNVWDILSCLIIIITVGAALYFYPLLPEKIITVHNGLDPKLSENILDRSEAKKELEKLSGRSFNDFSIVGTIANLYPTKGLNYLIDAASLIKKEKVIFIIIGFGPEEQILKKKIRDLNLSGKVFLLGEVSVAYRLLKGFDVFGLSSVKEGFPYALLEAFLAQVPIVATNAGGTPEIVSLANGILVEKMNAVALAEAIVKQLDNLKKTLPFPEEFSLNKMCQKTVEVYQNLT